MQTDLAYPLERYAATVAAHMLGPCDEVAVRDWIALCLRADGWRQFPGGFLAWFRVDWAHLEAVRARDVEAVSALPLEELRAGPVLVVAECLALTPGRIHKEVRDVIRQSGCEAVAAWRDAGTRWKVQMVRTGRNSI